MDPLLTSQTAILMFGVTAGTGGAIVKTVLDNTAGIVLKNFTEGATAGLTVWKEERLQRRRDAAALGVQFVEASGKTAHQIPGGILFKTLDHVSVEDDEGMRRRFAALLANTALYPDKMLPAFVGILAELSPIEAGMLEMRLIRFGGHVPKGGYDVPNGKTGRWPASAPTVL